MKIIINRNICDLTMYYNIIVCCTDILVIKVGSKCQVSIIALCYLTGKYKMSSHWLSS